MSSYEVMPRCRNSSFKVAVPTDRRTRHTILGFETEEEAAVWAEAEKKRDHAFQGVYLSDAD
jgi:hypothetical protein